MLNKELTLVRFTGLGGRGLKIQ